MQSSNGPELRGSTINLDNITAKTDLSNRHTKIVCTLGPACWEVDQLEKLIECGMSVARFNFSHGDHGGHQACLDRLRQAAANKNSHVGEFQNLSITVHFSFVRVIFESYTRINLCYCYCYC
jgi:pyruvate kinase